MLTSTKIRQDFLDFFASKEHKIVSSAPVIPVDDPTLLFTNAGMNQFKPIFLGLTKPAFLRAADSQKCIRAGGKHNDLDEVGKDGYHHTFFEMLGNWSFGDYYKKEAITWAWELLTKVWELPKDKLYATVYTTDDEAFELWHKLTDIAPDHISRFADKENFWEMGDTGPCGPCSEIHIDRGEGFCDKQHVPGHVCRVNGDCGRYIELWNLVFIQYNRQPDGSLVPLAHKYVDTGAGFERICQVLQDKSSNYETDVFMPVIEAIARLSGVMYDSGAAGMPHRVVADHLRALSFAIADGGLPSNEGRGYVLRRILRRASRYGRMLNFNEPFLYKLVDALVTLMGGHYSELADKRDFICTVIKAEEERFNLTLDRGLEIFAEYATSGSISGIQAFTLYDTYGFPLDLTCILAEEKGMNVDKDGFEVEMQKQRERARAASKFKMESADLDWQVFAPDTPTCFVGYDTKTTPVKVLRWALASDGLRLVLDNTPFYPEQGGQVCDTGVLRGSNSEIAITQVHKLGDVIIHHGTLVHGMVEASGEASVDAERREKIACHHTATHLLHAALRTVLGEHVQQKGSWVGENALRFDFTHFAKVEKEQLEEVNRMVNNKIRTCLPVNTAIMDKEQAVSSGAMAFFGEKYADTVRVVSCGDFSRELCGGTHVRNTGELGVVFVLNESSIAAGIRRIEAVCAHAAEAYHRQQEELVAEAVSRLGCQAPAMPNRINELFDEIKLLKKEVQGLQGQMSGLKAAQALETARSLKNGRLVSLVLQNTEQAIMRQVADDLMPKVGTGVLFIAAVNGPDKLALLCLASKDSGYHAGQIVAAAAAMAGGKGGGKPDVAMAGGKNPDAVNDIMTALPGIIDK